MESTITVTRKTTTSQSVALPLPYYAKHDDGFGTQNFYAITGERDNLRVLLFSTMGPHVCPCEASCLPEDNEQICEQEFIAAYEVAQRKITDKFLESCPSVKAPEASLIAA